MSLSERTADVLMKELAARGPEHREKLQQASEKFERLVQAGVVTPERYNVQPVSPSAPASLSRPFRLV